MLSDFRVARRSRVTRWITLLFLVVDRRSERPRHLRARGLQRLRDPLPAADRCALRLRHDDALGRHDFYAQAHPGPEDVLLLIEICDSSAAYDREVKVPLFAAHAVAEVWLVDVRRQAVEAFRDPDPARRGYRDGARFERGDELAPRALPELRLDVASILGA